MVKYVKNTFLSIMIIFNIYSYDLAKSRIWSSMLIGSVLLFLSFFLSLLVRALELTVFDWIDSKSTPNVCPCVRKKPAAFRKNRVKVKVMVTKKVKIVFCHKNLYISSYGLQTKPKCPSFNPASARHP